MTMVLSALGRVTLALIAAPLLLGVINRTKAFFAGRDGQTLLQPYFDLAKLLRKGAVYSTATTWAFSAGPMIALAAFGGALTLVPMGGGRALLAFAGDFVAIAALLAAARFAIVLAALDTGSAFEGMGASREVQFAALAEPALLVAFAALARLAGAASLSEIVSAITARRWLSSGATLLLIVAALAVVFFAENARIPFDDPNTHLELTMIHEVMVLDHSGPDLAFVQYGAALKMWVLGSLVVGVAVPVRTGNGWVDFGTYLLGMTALSIGVGILESSMARLRLLRVPQVLVGAAVLATLALVVAVR